MQSTTKTFGLLALFAAIASLLWSQGFTASVLGTVTDNTGAVVPGANVTVTNIDTGQQVNITTDPGGNYTAAQLPPGNYRVAVEVQGFKRAVREPITLLVDQRQQLDFKLELGNVNESVTVSAEAAQVQTETATVGTAVTQKQSTELPLNGRNFLQLNLLVPGAQSGVKGSTLMTQSSQAIGAIDVHGIRENSNYFWLDGMDDTNLGNGDYIITPPAYVIDEFRVMSPTYDAEFGRRAGAQINVIVKSGTNAWHGDAYELLRNSALDAKNFFDPAGKIPAYRRNQYGVDGGGKIKRDRTFVYGAFEGLRFAQGESASAIVPPSAYVQGNFSGLPTALKDPLTGQPFAGNVIPQNRMNPIGAAIAGYFPAPTGPNNSLFLSPIGTDSDDVVVAKLDQIITANNRFSIRAAFEDINFNQPIAQIFGITNIPGFGIKANGEHYFTTGINDTWTFTPNLVGQFRAGWNRWGLYYIQQDNATNIVAQLGLSGVTQDPLYWGFPDIQLAGVYSALGEGTPFPQEGPWDVSFFSPTLTWIKGKHTIKFGGDIHHAYSNFFYEPNARGTFSFSGQYSGNPLADLLLGVPNQATVAVFQNPATGQLSFKSNEAAGFIQDDWRITQRFTATFGLLYEYNFPVTEEYNRMSNFNPQTGQLQIAGQNGVGRSLYNADPKEFAPRIGIAWDPLGNGKWAVRGGYGIFYELIVQNQLLGLRDNYPFDVLETVLGDGKAITLSNVFSNATGAVIPSLVGFSPSYKAGRVQQFSAGIQRQLADDIVIDVGYVGTRGARLYGTVNVNQPTPAPGTVQTRRPYAQYANINVTEPAFASRYDGLEVRAEKRLSAGMHFLASYTFSKSDDDSSGSGGYNTLQDSHNIMGNWGPSGFDVRHRFVLSYLYELPFGRNRRFLSKLNRFGDAALGGWQFNGVFTVHTGQPFTPVLATDNSNTGQLADRPNVAGNPYESTSTCQVHTPTCWANAAAFAIPSQYTFGNAQRNLLTGPGMKELDFALDKNFSLTEKLRMEFRAEAFNLLNDVNFDNPSTTLSATFARITTAEASRQIQFGLRFAF